MPTNVSWNNTTYSIPDAGEFNWSDLSAFLQALGNNAQTTGAQFWNTRVVSAATDTLGATDAIVVCTNTGARTITLPAGTDGRVLAIIDGAGNAASFNVTIDGNGAETINGALTYVINDNYGGAVIAFDSTTGGWYGVASFVLDTLSNPMTTTGDIIRGGSAGAPTRLAIGSANTVLTSNGTTPAYALLVNANIDAAAAIVDTKLATISTAGKVSGSAITSGTIAGTTAWNTSGAITTSGVITGAGLLTAVGALDGTKGFAFTGDTNTGLRSSAADTVHITTGGTDRISIDSGGNVGIGATPGSKLEVADATSSYLTLRQITAGNPATGLTLGRTSEPLAFIEMSTATNNKLTGSAAQDLIIRTSGGARSILFGEGSTQYVKIAGGTGAVTLGASGGTQVHTVNGALTSTMGSTSSNVTLSLTPGTGSSSTRSILNSTITAGNDSGTQPLWEIQAERSGGAAVTTRPLLKLFNYTTEVLSVAASGAINAPLIHNVGSGNITSGTWTPTLTNTTNITSSSASQGQYIRVGKVVTCSVVIDITPTTGTAGTSTELRFSLPVTSGVFSGVEDLVGTWACTNFQSCRAGRVFALSTGLLARFSYETNGSTSAAAFAFTFTYEII